MAGEAVAIDAGRATARLSAELGGGLAVPDQMSATAASTLPAAVTLRIERLAGGRRRAAATLRRSGRAGANRVRFSGRIGRRALRRRRYRLTVRATDGAGNRSAARRAVFRSVR